MQQMLNNADERSENIWVDKRSQMFKTLISSSMRKISVDSVNLEERRY